MYQASRMPPERGSAPPVSDLCGLSASRIAHDIQAPLRRAFDLIGFVLEDYCTELPAAAATDLQRARDEAIRGWEFVRGTEQLCAAQLKVLEVEQVQLQALVDVAVAELRQRHADVEIQAWVDCDVGAPVDRELLCSALLALLDNAVRYTASDTVAIRVRVEVEENRLLLYVEDDGVGFADEAERQRVLQPLVRLCDRAPNRLQPGLGLTIAQVAAERHGGSLWLSPARSGGTCACLALPLPVEGGGPALDGPAGRRASPVPPSTGGVGEARAQVLDDGIGDESPRGERRFSSAPPPGAEITHDGAAVRAPALPSMFSTTPPNADQVRVLLIEDDEADFFALARMLERASGKYQLEWIDNPKAGVQAMIQNRHDVYVLDHYLAASSGIDVLRGAAEGGWFGPAILLTGADPSTVAMAAAEAGFSDFMSKAEWSLERLERAIRYCLERHRRASELAVMAYVDGLTGLLNARGLELSARPLLERARRTEQPLGVIMIDLNGFKLINDTHGHAAGNWVLREVARRLNERLRSSDVVARTGGDEFVAVLGAMASEQDGEFLLDELRALIRTPMVSGTYPPLTVGASIGLALRGQDGHKLSELLARADGAMYEDKLAQGAGR